MYCIYHILDIVTFIHIYVYMYINFVCHVKKCENIYISKTRYLFLQELYFDFLQTLEDSIKYQKI